MSWQRYSINDMASNLDHLPGDPDEARGDDLFILTYKNVIK
jgi:hypothetical protein